MNVNVSDHALVRFLERAGGLDIEGLRSSLGASLSRAGRAAKAIGAGEFAVKADGLGLRHRARRGRHGAVRPHARALRSAAAMKYVWLADLYRQISEGAGLEAALGLARARGGLRISVPRNPRAAPWLAEAMGEAGAALLCELYGGELIDLPADPVSGQGRTRGRGACARRSAKARCRPTKSPPCRRCRGAPCSTPRRSCANATPSPTCWRCIRTSARRRPPNNGRFSIAAGGANKGDLPLRADLVKNFTMLSGSRPS